MILNGVLIAKEFYYLAAIPFVFTLIFMAFFKLKQLMWFIVVMTPLSINLEDLELGGIGMYLPTEPLMFGVMILFFLKLIHKPVIEKRVLLHPVSLAIIFNLIWLLITSVTSEMPVVSFKFLLARLWFVTCFYFIAILLFKNYKNYSPYFLSYFTPLSFVIVYSVIRLASYGFEEQPSHWVMEPFFKDHTSYGAILAMYFPILFIYTNKRFPFHYRVLTYLLIIIYVVGIILSYTRAAWVSLILAAGLFIIYKYKIKLKLIAIVGLISVLFILFSWNSILMELERNNQDSSANLSEHVESISNVSTDASNLERLNRWSCAWRMFKERPVFGWGPGTYVFQYAPFQLSSEQTVISTNAGKLGNAHSEYIGPLAESGLIGTLSFIAIIIVVFYRGSLLYHKLPKGELKQLILFTLLGLFTYVVHGMLNNYLDTDKASVPFWGFIALIVSVDIFHSDISLKLKSE